MPENTADFDIPKPVDGDSPPSLEASVGPAFDRIDELFGAIDLSQLVVPGSSDGKLVVVKDGAAAYKAMSGDGTIDEDGVFQLGAGVVGATELGAKAVTAAKVDDAAITEAKHGDGSATSRKVKLTSGELKASETKSLGGEEVVIPGTTLNITPAVASILVVEATFYMRGASTGGGNLRAQAHGTVQVDGVARSEVVRYYADIVAGGTIGGSYSRVYRIPLTAAAHAIRLSAIADGLISSEVKVLATDTSYTYELFAS